MWLPITVLAAAIWVLAFLLHFIVPWFSAWAIATGLVGLGLLWLLIRWPVKF